LIFLRVGPDENTTAASVDHGPDLLGGYIGLIAARRDGNWFAYAVPPGRWRIAAMGIVPSIEFCLGSPAFDVGPGEVVYAGLFDLNSENLGPDLDLAPVHAWLAGQPQADAVRAAAYTNGWPGACRGAAEVYALEVDGAPFREGYGWGGAWRPDAPAASPAPAAANASSAATEAPTPQAQP
jgi:hypothetical protein